MPQQDKTGWGKIELHFDMICLAMSPIYNYWRSVRFPPHIQEQISSSINKTVFKKKIQIAYTKLSSKQVL